MGNCSILQSQTNRRNQPLLSKTGTFFVHTITVSVTICRYSLKTLFLQCPLRLVCTIMEAITGFFIPSTEQTKIF